MSEPPQEYEYADPKQTISHNEAYWSGGGIIALVVLALVAIVALIIGAGYTNTRAEWIQFLTVHSLSVLVLVFLIISTINSSKSWEVLRSQEIELTETRKAVVGQLKVMDKQLTEMKAQREISQTQIAQTGLQLISARDQTIEMIGQRKAMLDQWQAMQDALEQNERHFNTLNRPLLGIEQIDWAPKPRAGMQAEYPWVIKITIKNFGKAPAHEVQSISRLDIIDYLSMDETCPEPPYTAILGKQSKSVVPDGAAIWLTPRTNPLTQDNIANIWVDDNIFNGTGEQVMLWFELTYKNSDGSGDYHVRHHAKFTRAGFEPCDRHCDAN